MRRQINSSHIQPKKKLNSQLFFPSFQNLFPNPTCPNASTIRKLASLYAGTDICRIQKVIFDNLIGLDLHDNELYSLKR